VNVLKALVVCPVNQSGILNYREEEKAYFTHFVFFNFSYYLFDIIKCILLT
jgi:hypothetical protein